MTSERHKKKLRSAAADRSKARTRLGIAPTWKGPYAKELERQVKNERDPKPPNGAA